MRASCGRGQNSDRARRERAGGKGALNLDACTDTDVSERRRLRGRETRVGEGRRRSHLNGHDPVTPADKAEGDVGGHSECAAGVCGSHIVDRRDEPLDGVAVAHARATSRRGAGDSDRACEDDDNSARNDQPEQSSLLVEHVRPPLRSAKEKPSLTEFIGARALRLEAKLRRGCPDIWALATGTYLERCERANSMFRRN